MADFDDFSSIFETEREFLTGAMQCPDRCGNPVEDSDEKHFKSL